MPKASPPHVDHILASIEGDSDSEIEAVLRESWLRSAQHKIDVASDDAPQLLTASEIRTLREPAAQWLDVAQVELDRLYRLVRPARYVLLLCNADGVVVDHRGEASEGDQFKFWGTWVGGVWNEGIEGTNGIGTCIAEQRAITVHKSQHYRSRHITLSCSGAPVFAPDGAFVGVIDVSSIDPNLSEHAHALTEPLTVAAARAIEERMFRAQFRSNWILALRTPAPLNATMLMAVDADQRIVGADRTARGVLAARGIKAEAGPGFLSVFERHDSMQRRHDHNDIWTEMRLRDGERLAAIITPPESAVARRQNPEIADLHLRPRCDILVSALWKPQAEPVMRGGLAPATLRRVREYVDAHLHEAVSLDSMAAAAELSTFHFARAFKQSEGSTPHDFVLERRIAKARDLLVRTDLSLSQIAAAVGFSDQSHFTRRFREAVGISPGQFRKLQD